MNQEQLEAKIKLMESSEFFNEDDLAFLTESLIPEIIEKQAEQFGDNDGEPLDKDGINFLITYLKLKLYEANAIYEEN